MTKKQRNKTKQVILYLIHKCGKMSEKKLTYLLYFCEFDFYEKEERKLMGLTYYKTKNGIKIKELC